MNSTRSGKRPGENSNERAKMKTWKCSDGFVTRSISAASATEAAEVYAIVATNVDVVEVDSAGTEIGNHETVEVAFE